MGAGLIAGRVYAPNGSRASGAYVRIMKVEGDSGLIPIRGIGHYNTADATTDSNGKFDIPFTWSSADIADAIIPVDVRLVSYVDRAIGGGSEVLYGKAVRTRGFLIKDIFAQAGTALNTFQGIDDLAWFAVDLSESVKHFSKVAPIKVNMMSPENFAIIGGVYIQL